MSARTDNARTRSRVRSGHLWAILSVATSSLAVTSPAWGGSGAVITVPSAYCSATVTAAGNDGLLPTQVPVRAPTSHSQLVRDSRWDAWASTRIAITASDHERLAPDASATAAAALEARFIAQTRRMDSLLVVIRGRLQAVFHRVSGARRRALDATLRAFDATGTSAWSTYLDLLNVYASLCFAPQHVLATLGRIAPIPSAITATTLTAAAQAESASLPGLAVTVFSTSPVGGPLSTASLSVSFTTAGLAVVPATTVCLDFPVLGTAPATLVTC